jgi:phage terminase large subunit GpA-like protein
MSGLDRRPNPREALERDPDTFLAEGIAAFREGLEDLRGKLEVPEDLDIVEWTEEHFYLSPETAGAKQKVRWTGYQKGFLRMCQDPEIEVLVNPKSARTGMTQALVADGCYEIGHRRNQIMNVQPTDLKAQELSNDYLQPAFRDSPLLSKLIRKPKKGERQNTWCDVQYGNGGSARLGWASSDDAFRGRTAGKMYADEVDADAWEPTAASQGDKLALFLDRGEIPARRRSSTPSAARAACATPTPGWRRPHSGAWRWSPSRGRTPGSSPATSPCTTACGFCSATATRPPR